MPILRQRKDDGGHYVRAWVPGTAAIATWQLTPVAVAAIQARFGRGEEVEFPQSLLRELIERGQAYTGGGGIDPLQLTISRDSYTASRSRSVSLLFVEQGDTWGLALRITELPSAWAAGVDDLLEALAGWRIIVEGESRIPATRLYPGSGGALIPVPPQAHYSIRVEGMPPRSWGVESWLIPPAGLGAGRAFFRGDTGERISPSSELEPGESFTMVVADCLATGQGRLLPPASISAEYLGRVDQWRAWSIDLPASPDEQARSWCEQVGLKVAEPRFRLSLVTPPRAYTDDRQAIVAAGEELVLALIPLQAHEDPKPGLLTTRIDQTGPITLSAKHVLSSSLRLLVQPCDALPQQATPPELSLRVRWGDLTVGIGALRAASPTELRRPAVPSADSPLVEVLCPAPVRLSLQLGRHSALRHETPADEAGPLLAEALREATRRKQPFLAQLDAGAFGRISVKCPEPQDSSAERLALSPAVVRRARWLAAMLTSRPNREALAPVPASLVPTLAQFAAQPGCEILASLKFIPPSLLPSLRAIASLAES